VKSLDEWRKKVAIKAKFDYANSVKTIRVKEHSLLLNLDEHKQKGYMGKMMKIIAWQFMNLRQENLN
jgi:hypothetical protein